MRKEKRRTIIAITAIIVVVLLILGTLAPALMGNAETSSDDYDSQYSSLQNKQKALEQKHKQLESSLSSNKDKQTRVKADISDISQNIFLVKQQIDILNNKINDCNDKIAQKDKDIAATQTRIKQNTELYKQRMVALYEAGNVSRIQVLLSSKSITDFLARFDVMKMISQHDNDLINKLKVDKQTLENDKQAVVQESNTLKATKEQFDAKKKYFDAQAAEQNKLYGELKDKQAEIKSQEDEIDEKESETNNSIAAIIKQKEEEASRAAASNGGGASGGSTAFVGGTWIWPVQGCSTYISSPFGPRAGHSYPHTGIDIAGGGIAGQPILASNSGTVLIAGWDDSGIYGNYVVIDSGGGMTALYGHCSGLNCSVGETVKTGQVIAYVGNTGNVVSLGGGGYHLHFQIMVNGTPVNPLNYVHK